MNDRWQVPFVFAVAPLGAGARPDVSTLFPLVGVAFFALCAAVVVTLGRPARSEAAASFGAQAGAVAGLLIAVGELYLALPRGGGPLGAFDVFYLGPLAVVPLVTMGAWAGGEAAGGRSARPVLATLLALVGATVGVACGALFFFAGAIALGLFVAPWTAAFGAVLGYGAGRRQR